jgi:hypothetical protein
MVLPPLVLTDVPLPEALAQISQAAGVAIRLAPQRDPALPNLAQRLVTADATGRKLADVLSDITQQVGGSQVRVNWWINGDAIVISAETDFERMKVTRIYDMRDWLARAGSTSTPTEKTPGNPSPANARAAEDLRIALMEQIDPVSWRGYGGVRGAVQELGGYLAITQTWENQVKVRRFLNAVRATQPQLVAPVARNSATRPAARAEGRMP